MSRTPPETPVAPAGRPPLATRVARALGEGWVSDLLLTLSILNVLLIPMAAGFRFDLGPWRVSSPSPAVSGALMVGLLAYRVWWRRRDTVGAGLAWAFVRRYRTEVALVVVVGVGLAVRLWGIGFGFPLITHPDEPETVDRAVGMLQRGSLDPQWYIYPTFYMNLLLPAFAVRYIAGAGDGLWRMPQEVALRDPGFYAIGRYYSAAFGTLAIVLAFVLARRLWAGREGDRAGLIAATLVAVSFNSVRQSHYAVTDATVTAVVTGALIAATYVYTHGRPRDYVLAGLLGGLAGSTKYNALPVVLSLVVAHGAGRPWSQWVSGRALAGAAAVPAGFLIGSPAILWNWRPFLEHLGWLSRFSAGATPELAAERFRYLIVYAFESGFGVVGAAAVIAALMAVAHRRKALEWVVLVFVLGLIPLMTNSTLRWVPRNLVPLYPAVYVLVGGMLVLAVGWLHRRRWLPPAAAPLVLVLATVAMAGQQAVESVGWSRMMAQEDSRVAAYRWLTERFPDGAVVASDVSRFWLPDGYRLVPWPRAGMSPAAMADAGVQAVLLTGGAGRAPGAARSLVLTQVFQGVAHGQAGPEIVAYLVPSIEANRRPS